MSNHAAAFYSTDPDSMDAGRDAGEHLVAEFAGRPLKVILVYATMNHDQGQVLSALRSVVGPDVAIVGCSSQGVVVDRQLTEEGFALGVMGLGSREMRCATAIAYDFEVDTRTKGQSLARELKSQLGAEPGAVVIFYDPLCGADVEALLGGMRLELACPLIGGSASQPWGKLVKTFQYCNDEIHSRSVVALALRGGFTTEVGICHGTAPTGVGVTVTKAAGHEILELDGKRAVDVWREATGCGIEDLAKLSDMAAWALGVEHTFEVPGPSGPETRVGHAIRCAFGFNPETGSMMLQAPIQEGTRVMFHHRTVERVLEGTTAMAEDLSKRIAGRVPWAVLGFECGARTYPFLGPANTIEEHTRLRATVAPGSPWLGMMAWGEIGPVGGVPAFHNYTYPLLVLLPAGDAARAQAGAVKRIP
jgi:hypothetical protein